MIVGFAERGWEDYLYWQRIDRKIIKRINLLLADSKEILLNIRSRQKIFSACFVYSVVKKIMEL